jgi:hypothetical protein
MRRACSIVSHLAPGRRHPSSANVESRKRLGGALKKWQARPKLSNRALWQCRWQCWYMEFNYYMLGYGMAKDCGILRRASQPA